MSSKRSHSHQDSSLHEESLLIDDLVRYFSQLASMNGEYRTGNQELSVGLRQFAKALRPHADLTVSEFVDQIKKISNRNQASPKEQRATLPPDIESVSQQEIEDMLGSDRYTKTQMIEVGIRRFGIPRSKLERSNKKDVLNSIFAALNHEKSLDVISKEASRGARVS